MRAGGSQGTGGGPVRRVATIVPALTVAALAMLALDGCGLSAADTTKMRAALDTAGRLPVGGQS